MATLTASNAGATIQPRSVENGTVTVPVAYNSGSTVISATASTVLLCKIPHGATILDYNIHHNSGASTCAADYGTALAAGGGITASALGSTQAKAAYNNANVTPASTAYAAGVPQKVSVSDDSVARYKYFTGTFANGSATTSLIVQGTVTYTLDGTQA